MEIRKIQLFRLWFSLSAKELTNFGEYLGIKAFNRKPEFRKIYDQLVAVSSVELEKMSREELFGILFPDRSFDDQYLRNTCFKIQQLLQKFLLIEKINLQEFSEQNTLLDIFRERELDDLFQQQLRKIKNNQQKNSLRDYQYYHRQFSILDAEDSHTALQLRSQPTHFQEADQALEFYFILRKLRQACNLLGHQNLQSVEYDFGLLEPVLNYIKEKKLDQVSVLDLYYNCYFSLAEPEEDLYFFKFRDLLSAQEKLLSVTETGELYLRLLNQYIRRINQGQNHYLEAVFKLYQSGIERGYLFEGEYLSRFIYRNAVFSGLKLQKFTEVYDFMYEYKNKLDGAYRDSTFYFCLTRYHYAVGDMGKAIDLLQQYNYKDLLSNLAAKTLMAKIYFEQNERDVLEYFLISFTAVVKRKKGLGYHRASFLNFISILKKINKLADYDPENRKKLIAKIKVTHPLTERNWLLKKLSDN